MTIQRQSCIGIAWHGAWNLGGASHCGSLPSLQETGDFIDPGSACASDCFLLCKKSRSAQLGVCSAPTPSAPFISPPLEPGTGAGVCVSLMAYCVKDLELLLL